MKTIKDSIRTTIAVAVALATVCLVSTVAPAATVTAIYNAATDVPVTAGSYTATGNTVTFTLNFAPATGTDLMVVKNMGLSFISGTFSSLTNGQKVMLTYGGTNYNFVANYYGGSGNDLVLVWAKNRLFAWGYDYYGQLGDNNIAGQSLPVPVTASGVLAGKTVVAIAAGQLHSLALCSDGTVAAWGYSSYGQLGDNTTNTSLVPVTVSTASGVSALYGKTVVAIAAGYAHSLALCSDGTVAAWGDNSYGQLGDNTTTSRSVPVAVNRASGISALYGKTVVAIGAGYSHSLALCSDGTVAAWGYNSNGQLGDNTTTSHNVPVAVNRASGISALYGKTVVAIGAGYGHSMALCSDGTPTSWGFNGYGQLGDNTTTSRRVPVAVNTASGVSALYGKTVVAITAGAHHSLALCSDATLAAWGYNASGQLGDNTTTQRLVPVPVNRALGVSALYAKTVVAIAAGYTHSLASCADGTVAAWGNNYYGQLGDNTTTYRLAPVAVSTTPLAAGERFTRVSSGAGASHSLALVAESAVRTVLAWGYNYYGELGDNTTANRLLPVPVPATGVLAAKTVVAAAVGKYHSLALCSDGTVAAWGDNHYGQLGDNTTTDRHVPVAVNTASGVLNGKMVVAIAAGESHSLALCSDGTVAAWGYNFYGQLGDNTTTNRHAPVVVNTNAKRVVAISAGFYHSLALCSDGTVAAWGYNYYGQLGDNTTNISLRPVTVNRASGVSALFGKTVAAISAGGYHNLALCSDGTVAAWGYNSSGRLGDNTTTTRLVPVAVSTVSGVSVLWGKTVEAVAAGGYHSLALCSDGTVAAWGNNYYGYLGDTTTAERHVPVAVNAGSGVSALYGRTVVSIAAGLSHSLALCLDGTLAAWGWNDYGQLGDNTTSQRNAPVTVSTAQLATGERFGLVSSGSSAWHTLALVTEPPAPEINVTGNGLTITNGDATPSTVDGTDFGNAVLGTAPMIRSFTIQNAGTARLNLTGNPKVAVSGPHAADFTVVLQPASPVPKLPGITTFRLAFAPSALGARTATLSISNDDEDENPYHFAVRGTGSTPGTLNAIYNAATDVPVTASSYNGAGNTVNFTLNYETATGTELMVVKNTGPGLINGTFSNLTNGQPVALSYAGTIYHFVANYYGGSGNDLVLTWANNRLFAWGWNQEGQLGDNSSTQRPLPVPVTATGVLAGKTVVTIAAGSQHSLALCADGTLAAWGRNDCGQLGDNTTTQHDVPVAVNTASGISALFGKTVVAISAGGQHSLALCSDGTLAAWGDNSYGQLGDNTTTQHNAPVAVNTASGVSALYGKTVVAVAAGWFYSLALCSDGTLAAWGDNSYGQIGNINTTRVVPTAVNTASADSALYSKTVVAIAAGGYHSLALCLDGTMAAWGANPSGQLGDNTRTQHNLPVAVNTASGISALFGKTVVAIAAGSSHSLALCSDGTVAAWGDNNLGYLGDNTTTTRLVPVVVSTVSGFSALFDKTVVAIAAGGYHSLALCSDGSVAAWGLNQEGQLGDDNASSYESLVPILVNTTPLAVGERFSRVSSGSSGAVHTLALVATPPAPTITVTGYSLAITNGDPTPSLADGTDFGSALAGGGTIVRTFTIQNTGPAPLSLTGSPRVAVSGPQAADFTVTVQPASPVASLGGTTTVQVTFAPSAEGLRTATLSIANNDADKNPYVFAVQGDGSSVLVATYNTGSEVPLTVTGLTATGKWVDFTLNYAPAPGTELVVVRKTGLGFITGTFEYPAQGQMVALSYGGTNYMFVANYYGGSGNDLVLVWAKNRPFAWGNNDYGQLGDNTSGTNRLLPVPVTATGLPVGLTVVAVAASETHSLGLCSDGSLAACGFNNSGQLGDNTTTTRSMPVAVNTTPGVSALSARTVVAIAAGHDYSLALCSDGTAAAWGDNSYGQLGDSTMTNRLLPVAVSTASGISALYGKTVVAIAAGYGHSLALCSDGTVVAWGDNSYGQLGDNSVGSARSTPVAVNTDPDVSALCGKTVVAIAAGYGHSLALCSDGTLAAWGVNWFGQLGDHTTTSRPAPVAVNTAAGISALYGKTVRAIAAGYGHSLALCSDGSPVAWGYNYDGELGDGTTTTSAPYGRTVPVAVNAALSVSALYGKTVVAMAAGAYHSLARCSDGTVAAWGDNSFGQLGDNTTAPRITPVAVNTTTLAAGARVTLVAGGSCAYHTLALVAAPPAPEINVFGYDLITNGDLAPSLWDGTDFGYIPVGGTNVWTFWIENTGMAPLNLTGTLRVAVSGANAAEFSVTRQPSSPVEGAWGGTTFQVTLAPRASGTRTATLSIANDDVAQNPFVFAIQGTGGTSLAATYNTGSEVPLTVSGLAAEGNTVSFTLNYAPATGTELMVVKNTSLDFINHTFDNLTNGQMVALSYGGVIYNFVANYYGGSGNDLVLVWANNRTFAWGWNDYGQLGDNTSRTNRLLPVPVRATGVLSGKTLLAIAAGNGHSLALCSDGTVAAWGDNSFGQLGDNTTTERHIPVAVNTASGVSALYGKTVVAIAAGQVHSLALCSDGTVAAWGYNVEGEVGDNTTTERHVPVAVNTNAGLSALYGKTVVAIAGGVTHSLALCSDGTVVGWGANYNGELGDNTTVERDMPVAVNTNAGLSALYGKTVVAIAAGGWHSLARCSDGTLAAWGDNSYGQLGDYTTTSRPVPVAVNQDWLGFGFPYHWVVKVVAIGAGSVHSVAQCSDGTAAAWGWNDYGQLGDNTSTERDAPVAVNTNASVSALYGKTVGAIAAGANHSLVLCSDGTVAAWGDNEEGELGDNTSNNSPAPVVINATRLGAGERFTRVSSGPAAWHTLALVAAPPAPEINVTGNGVSITNPDFTPSPADGTDFGSALVGGGTVVRTFTIQNLGTAPLNLTGTPKVAASGPQAADFTVTLQPNSPVASQAGRTTFQVTFAPSAGGPRTATLLIRSDDAAKSLYVFAIQGTGSITTLAATYTTGTEVPVATTNFTATGRTVNFTLNYAPGTGTELMVVKNTGLGFLNGTFDNLTNGQTVTLSYGGNNYTFAANYYGGNGNDLVLAWANSRAFAWGYNLYGQLGDNSSANNRLLPVPVTSSGVLAGKTLLALAAGANHSLALCSDGTLAAWGDNSLGQLGDNGVSGNRSLVPVAVNTLSAVSALFGKTVVAIAAGDRYSLALCSDGTVASWGDNHYGQLGNNTTTGSLVPLAINTASGVSALYGKTVVAIAAGANHSLALCSSGTVVAWGLNNSGQLGDNTTMQRNAPVVVNTNAGVSALYGKTVAAIAAGADHSLALCSGGTVVAWGYNYLGQLGDNTTTQRSAPVAVNTNAGVSALYGKTVAAIAAGKWQSSAFSSDGTVVAWGYNFAGQLGDNTTTSRYVPVAVNTVSGVSVLFGRTVTAIAAGNEHSLALCSDGAAAWGNNSYGQLADNDNTWTNRRVPVAVRTTPLAASQRFARVASGPLAYHTLALVAGPLGPAINVTGRGLSVANGDVTPSTADGTDGGNTALGAAGMLSFTIWNVGGAPLSLTGTPKVAVSGLNATEFTVTSPPGASLTGGGATTFQVTFAPAALGTRAATLSIASDDPNNNPYVFAIQGTGVKAPATVTLGNLSQTCDGTAKCVSVTTTPPGLTVNVTYTGSPNAPTNVGSYTVIGTISDPHYQGTATNTLIISLPLPTPITLTSAKRLAGGAVQFAFTNTPGASFSVLATTNLVLPLSQWTVIDGVTEVSPGRFQFADSQAVNYRQRFYRVRSNLGTGTVTTVILTHATKVLNGALQFGFSNTPGASFTVLATTNLALPLTQWTALSGVTEVLPGQFQFTDPQATNSPQRFYRVRSP